MATARITKWDSTDVFTDNAEIHTRMFDFGDTHAKKKISKFFMTFTGNTTTSTIIVNIYYRFNNYDSWKVFGFSNVSSTTGRIAEIQPIYNSATSYRMEKGSGGEVRIKNVKTIQFKIGFLAQGAVEINDYGVEFRNLKRNNISAPEV
tara:strand:+ start:5189 stop:5632 length:444 start_codon:yes stop_codon:yes gene_type:complete